MRKNSQEESLLLFATQPEEIRDKDKIAKLITEKLDWESIFKTAAALELIPLLNAGISPFYKTGNIPDKTIRLIKEKVRFVAGLNLGYFEELKSVLKRFNKKDIPLCLLKGSAITLSVYKSKFLRSFGDIDLLIKREDLDAAIEVFSDGYNLDFFLPNLDMCKKHHFHVALTRKDSPNYCFELHWELFTPDSLLDLPSAELWKDMKVSSFENLPILTLSPENAILHISIHFTRNAFSSPRDLWDIHWILNRESVDLNLLAKKAKRFKLDKRLAVCLLYVDTFFKTSYTSQLGLQEKLNGFGDAFILKNISIDFLVRAKKNSENNIRVLIAFLLQDGAAGKLRFLKSLICPGIYWLTIYPQDLSKITVTVRAKIALRALCLITYLIKSFFLIHIHRAHST